jgi:hypothetical protein
MTFVFRKAGLLAMLFAVLIGAQQAFAARSKEVIFSCMERS